MLVRLAQEVDLPCVQSLYRELVEKMYQNGLKIWDEIYPCQFVKEDIENKRLYVLEEGGKLFAAFALCSDNPGAKHMKWEQTEAKALYLDRLGVCPRVQGKGWGSYALKQVAVLAEEKGAEYLRLFVVDCNEPAIRLYRKNQWKQAEGAYIEIIDDALSLRELGFEMRIGQKNH